MTQHLGGHPALPEMAAPKFTQMGGQADKQTRTQNSSSLDPIQTNIHDVGISPFYSVPAPEAGNVPLTDPPTRRGGQFLHEECIGGVRR